MHPLPFFESFPVFPQSGEALKKSRQTHRLRCHGRQLRHQLVLQKHLNFSDFLSLRNGRGQAFGQLRLKAQPAGLTRAQQQAQAKQPCWFSESLER